MSCGVISGRCREVLEVLNKSSTLQEERLAIIDSFAALYTTAEYISRQLMSLSRREDG